MDQQPRRRINALGRSGDLENLAIAALFDPLVRADRDVHATHAHTHRRKLDVQRQLVRHAVKRRRNYNRTARRESEHLEVARVGSDRVDAQNRKVREVTHTIGRQVEQVQ